MTRSTRVADGGLWMLGLMILLIGPASARPEEVAKPNQNEGGSIRSLWPAPAAPEVRRSLEPGMGFSFAYDGQEIGPVVPADWQLVAKPQGESVQTIFRHPSGLTAIRRARAFADFDAIEYSVTFKNESPSALPPLSAVRAMDLSFTADFGSGATVFSSGGGTADAKFPPKNFALKWTTLGPPSSNHIVALGSSSGVPSAEDLPFFLVDNAQGSGGIYVAIGWTGQWQANLRWDSARKVLRLQAGVPDLDIKLQPGEAISGPTMVIGGYSGPLASGCNRLRQLIRTQYAPRVGDRELLAPVLYTTWFNIGSELDEKLAMRLVDCAAEMGVEMFLVDASWYAGTPSHPYTDMRSTWEAISNSLGNWELGEDRARFPSGLRPLAEKVRAQGMQFGLWFEPERSGPDSLLARQHPDWVVRAPREKWLLVDFGKPEVQEYFCRILDRYIRDLQLRYIRWDHNFHLGPLPFCAAQDSPGRRGISQIRYLEGLHRVEDWVRQQHPEVIFESCAGGGRRIELDTLRRRHTIWISDQTMKPDHVRFHLEGLNHFLPGNAQMIAFTPAPAQYQPSELLPDILYQSHFGGAFGAAGRIHEWSATVKQQMRKHVEVFKKMRRFLVEDYYLLGEQSRSLDTWSAWQFHAPKSEEGFVQAFRLQATGGSRRFPLKGLSADAKYQFSDPYSGKTFEATGATLLSPGLEFTLAAASSQVWLYRKI